MKSGIQNREYSYMRGKGLFVGVYLCMFLLGGCEPPPGREGDWTEVASTPMSALEFIDDTKVVVGFQDGDLKVYDLQADKFTAAIRKMQKNVTRVANWGDRTAAVSLDNESGPIVVWDRTDGTTRRLKPDEHWMVHDARWSPDGKYLAAVQGGVGLIVWDIAKRNIVYTYQGEFARVAWSSTGKYICVGGYIPEANDDEPLLPRQLIAINFDGKDELFRLPMPHRVRYIHCSKDRIVCGLGDRITVYSNLRDDPKLLKEIPLSNITSLTEGGMLIRMAYSEQKNIAACLLWPLFSEMEKEKQMVSVVSLSESSVLAKWTAKAPLEAIRGVAFSPDGSQLAVSGEEGLYVLDVDAALQQAGGRVEDEE